MFNYIQVQEINEGLTKPVEKPIPKPLPPTVCLETDSSIKAKRSLDEKFKSQLQTNSPGIQLESTDQLANSSLIDADSVLTTSIQTESSHNDTGIEISTNHQIDQTSATTSSSSTTSLTSYSSSSLSSLSPNEASSSSSSSSSSISLNSSTRSTSSTASSGYGSFKRFKSSHSMNNRPNGHPYHSTPSYSQVKSTLQPPPTSSYYNQYNQQFMQTPAVNPFSNTNNQAYYTQTANMPVQLTANSHLNPVYHNYQTNKQFYPPQFQPQQNIPHIPHGYYQTQQQGPAAYLYQQQRQQQQVQYQSQYPQYFTQVPQQYQQQNQQSLTLPVTHQASMSQNQIKTEPYDPASSSNQIRQNNETTIANSSNPYFTNPIPFKHEPNEHSDKMNSSDSVDDKNGFEIVSHFLKDKQILNQLEKVAQSFRIN